MKLTRRPTHSNLGQIESALTEMFGKGPQLSTQARQQIWRRAHGLAHTPTVPQHHPAWFVFYPAFVLLLVFGFLGGYSGVVFASGATVPGEPLYPIARQTETVWLNFTPESRRCEVQLVLLERRVYEAKALLDAGKIVPNDVLQEIELLFIAVADDTTCQSTQTASALPYLISYRAKLAILTHRHPGVSQLGGILEAANSAVIKLGGAPLELIPPDSRRIYQPI
ncbi:MAG TPA: DUF5667 domain-containing protein [Anaerolineae bacterium]|nr:DUF5667 domain-containing protein [Anaerolineae bacterium]